MNYVHPKDSIGAGAIKPYERHIGSTFYIGSPYQLENAEHLDNYLYRFYTSIAGENYHGLNHYKFDIFVNINNPLLTNVLTGQAVWKSPRYFSTSFATIALTPQHLQDTAKELESFIARVQELCTEMRKTAYLLEDKFSYDSF